MHILAQSARAFEECQQEFTLPRSRMRKRAGDLHFHHTRVFYLAWERQWRCLYFNSQLVTVALSPPGGGPFLFTHCCSVPRRAWYSWTLILKVFVRLSVRLTVCHHDSAWRLRKCQTCLGRTCIDVRSSGYQSDRRVAGGVQAPYACDGIAQQQRR